MSKIVKFDFRGDSIFFEFVDGNRMINATEMAKALAKPARHMTSSLGWF